MAYASRTGTARNLDALRRAGWGLLISARGEWRTEGFATYGIDNGAWSSFQRGEPFDFAAFEGVVARLGDGAEWIVAPDIVAGGAESLRLSMEWLPRLAGTGRRRLIAVQDGISPVDVEPLVGRDVGVFVGGSTHWKWASLPYWGLLARRRGCYLHVGRVNSGRRIRECAVVGAHSFDGTSCTRWAKNVPKLDNWRRQLAFAEE